MEFLPFHSKALGERVVRYAFLSAAVQGRLNDTSCG
jgi:hypothetical protein